MLELELSNGSKFSIVLLDNPVAEFIRKSLKHLQHLPLNFRQYDNVNNTPDYNQVLDEMLDSAAILNIEIDTSKLTDQSYLNALHKLYEKGYNRGSNTWLVFHESIHEMERLISKTPFKPDVVFLNYRDKAGLLEKKFDITNMQYSVLKAKKGTCYCRWSELGKTPLDYWRDGEPTDIVRFKELAKPWTVLRPWFIVANKDISYEISAEERQAFEEWFAPLKDEWLKQWGLSDWTVDDIQSIIPIGELQNIDQFYNEILIGATPIKLTLK